MADPRSMIGRRIRLVFDVVDATPDLPEFGPVTARIKSVDGGAPNGSARLLAEVEAPEELQGLTLVSEPRYEEESFEHAMLGRPVTVNAQILDRGQRAVGGGIATLLLQRP